MPSSPPRHAARQHGAMEFSTPPCDLDTVRHYRLARIRQELKRHDVAGALVFNQINTRYATDATNMQVWCAHYETRCAFIATDGPVVLFDYANHPHLAEDLPTVDEYRVMPSFYFFTAGSNSAAWATKFGAEIADLVQTHGGGNRRIAIDRLSHLGVDAIRSHGIEVVDGEGPMEVARAVKSTEELTLMRAAIVVCETGMQEMRESLTPGITENALWAKLHEVNIRLGGEWIETRLLSSGQRTNPWFRECSMRPIEAGDMVSFDTDLIGPYGYCADISRSWRCGDGKPNDEQRRLYATAHSQIEYNIALMRPGTSFRELAEKAWPIPEEFQPNRYGSAAHGIGLADEYPAIKHAADYGRKGYDGILEPGMTLCVESYIGSPGGAEGIKLEEQILVTEGAPERLSVYPMEDDWL